VFSVHDQIVNTISDVKLKPWNVVKAKAWAAAIFTASLQRHRRSGGRSGIRPSDSTPAVGRRAQDEERPDFRRVATIVDNSLGKPLSLDHHYYGSELRPAYNYNTKVDYFTNYATDYCTRYNSREDTFFGNLFPVPVNRPD